MVRNILGFIAGFVVAYCVSELIQLINYLVVPLPVGFDPQLTAFYREFIAQMPAYGHLLIGVSYLIGSLMSGAVVGLVITDHSKVIPVGVAILMMLLWTARFVVIPHPLWLVLVTLLIFIPATIYGYQAVASYLGNDSD